jgi:hypothetical protein
MKTNCLPVMLILTVLLFAPYASGTQNTTSVIASFKGNLVPVQQVVETGDSVLVKYDVDLALSPDAFRDDIPYILGIIAREYPASKTIRIDCFVGDEPVRYYEVKTADVAGYAGGKLSDTQIAALIQPETPDAGMKSRIQSSYGVSANGSGLFQIKGVLVLALEQAGSSSAALSFAVIGLVAVIAAGVCLVQEISQGG